MIRPEVASELKRWVEPAVALAATLAALWVVGMPGMRWGWLSLALALPIVVAGGVWLRVAVRRALMTGPKSQGSLFVEERRVLHVGPLGNVQVDLDEVTRIDLLVSSRRDVPPGLMVYLPDSPPVSLPLDAEGSEGLLDAMTGLPGFSADRFHAQRARAQRGAQGVPMLTVWTRD